MAIYNITIIGTAGSLGSTAIKTQNVNVGDSINLTIIAGVSWSTTATNCTRSPTSGFNYAPTNVTTVFFPNNGAYTLDIVGVTNFPSGGSISYYARLQGTASGASLDYEPDPFSFSTLDGVQLNTTYESEAVTITGITGIPTVSVSGGSYYIRDNSTSAWTGPFTANGTISNNQQIKVSVKSANTYDTATAVHLTIFNVTKSFTVKTIIYDNSPTYIEIPTKSDVELSQEITSDTVTPLDYTVPVTVTITSLGTASFSIAGGTFSDAAKTMTPGDSLAVKVTSSSSYATNIIAYIWVNGGLYTSFVVGTRARDTTPDGSITFDEQRDAVPNQLYISNAVTISGVEGDIDISRVSGTGDFAKNGTANTDWTTTSFKATNGDKIYARQRAINAFSSSSSTVYQLGALQSTYKISTQAADTTPDDTLTFTPVPSAELNTPYTSNSVKITGINTPVTIKRTEGNGEFSTNAGATWLTADTLASVNTNVIVKQMSSSQYNTLTKTTLSIGTASTSFSVTTRVDDIPDAFDFGGPITSATRGQPYESNTVTIKGLAVASALSFSGQGEYSKNGNPYTNSSTGVTVVNDDTIKIKIVADAGFNTNKTATVTIGGVSDSFSVTTLQEDKTPDNYVDFTAQTQIGINQYAYSNEQTITGINTSVSVSISADPFIPTEAMFSINGGDYTSTTVDNFNSGDKIKIRLKAPETIATTTTAYLTIGTITRIFRITSESADTTPDGSLLFNEVFDAIRGQSYIATNSITISGVNTTITISRKSGSGEFRVGTGDWRTTAINVTNGAVISIKQNASPSFGTKVTTELNMGSAVASFSVTTIAADTYPGDPWGYDSIDLAERNTEYPALQPIKITAINTPISISRKSGSGSFSLNGTTWVTSATNVEENALVYIKQTSSPDYNTAVTTELNIGSRVASFTVTTVAEDNTPDTLNFGDDITGAAFNQDYFSNKITLTGFNSIALLEFSGQGFYSKNGANYTNLTSYYTDTPAGPVGPIPVTVVAGDTLQLKVVSGSSFGQTKGVTVTINGVSDSFNVTTITESTLPSQFYFTDITDGVTNALYTSNEITVSGINSTATVTFSGDGSFRRQRNGVWGTYQTTNSSAVLGDKFDIQIQSASTSGTSLSGTLNIGGVEDTYTVTTSGSSTDTTPDQFPFTARSEAELSTSYPSNEIIVSGINSPASLSITNGEYELNRSNSWNTIGTTVSNGTIVRVKATSASTYSTLKRVTLTIGGVESNFDIVTKSQDTSSDYGFEVYNSSGVKTLAATTRTARLVASGSTSVTVQPQVGTYYSANIPVAGITSDDSWVVLIYEDSSVQYQVGFYTERGTNFFRVVAQKDYATSGTASSTFNLGYYILRN